MRGEGKKDKEESGTEEGRERWKDVVRNIQGVHGVKDEGKDEWTDPGIQWHRSRGPAGILMDSLGVLLESSICMRII